MNKNKKNIIAFNGSPRRKKWNTITLLEKALEGADSMGAETELIQLYGLKYSGCISCFACKRLNRKEDGVCAVIDDLSSVLEKVRKADALIIGTPVYYGAETAATRAFIERLCFPYNKYAKDGSSLFPRMIRTALIYTMNVNDAMIDKLGYNHDFNLTKGVLENTFGECELLLSKNTKQFSDYKKYEHGKFDVDEKLKRHNEVFPMDCDKAFELGRKLVL